MALVQTATVPGNPIPKERPRVVRGGRAYTPKRTRDAEAWVRHHALKTITRCAKGPVRLGVAFYRKDAVPCDLDNLAKLVSDALNGHAWVDDRQILVLAASKGIDRNNPRTEITIEEIA